MLDVGFRRVWPSQSHFLLLIWASALGLSNSFPDLFIFDFVLPIDVKLAFKHLLMKVCLCYAPGVTHIKKDWLYIGVKNSKFGLDGDDL